MFNLLIFPFISLPFHFSLSHSLSAPSLSFPSVLFSFSATSFCYYISISGSSRFCSALGASGFCIRVPLRVRAGKGWASGSTPYWEHFGQYGLRRGKTSRVKEDTFSFGVLNVLMWEFKTIQSTLVLAKNFGNYLRLTIRHHLRRKIHRVLLSQWLRPQQFVCRSRTRKSNSFRNRELEFFMQWKHCPRSLARTPSTTATPAGHEISGCSSGKLSHSPNEKTVWRRCGFVHRAEGLEVLTLCTKWGRCRLRHDLHAPPRLHSLSPQGQKQTAGSDLQKPGRKLWVGPVGHEKFDWNPCSLAPDCSLLPQMVTQWGWFQSDRMYSTWHNLRCTDIWVPHSSSILGTLLDNLWCGKVLSKCQENQES